LNKQLMVKASLFIYTDLQHCSLLRQVTLHGLLCVLSDDAVSFWG